MLVLNSGEVDDILRFLPGGRPGITRDPARDEKPPIPRVTGIAYGKEWSQTGIPPERYGDSVPDTSWIANTWAHIWSELFRSWSRFFYL